MKWMLALVAVWGVCLQTFAVDFPKLPVQVPADGGKYVLVNPANLAGYMSRTSWDGAYYFLGANDSQYAKYAITAHAQEDGSWTFTSNDDKYLAFPAGSGNLKADGTEPAYFTLQQSESFAGMYHIVAGEGQSNGNVTGCMIHLNAGSQYFVISVPGDSWYPDFCGGRKMDPEFPEEPLLDEDGNYIMADSTSTNWAFVLVEDLPKVAILGEVYGMLNVYGEQTEDELFGKGFALTLKAAEELYNSEDFDAEKAELIKAMLDAKQNLMKSINNAYDTDEDALAKAIAAAQDAFDNQSDTDAVVAAIEALEKAILDYSLGLGDVTALGVNMSFEDLSAQNGQMSNGKAAVPFGWKEYRYGEEVVGVPEYGFGWHGVNDDCDGYKDGSYGFGVWATSVDDFELSQTITGLDNGTYTITAGLMVNENRRTTQRIFGNLNSTLFGSAEEYAESAAFGECKEFAGLSDAGSERTLQPVSVRAYVYDGTLTFGVRTDNDFEAALRGEATSGDGWFKVDNFTISKDGYIEEDALKLVAHLYDLNTIVLEEAPMNSVAADSLKEELAKYDIGSGKEQAVYDKAIAELYALLHVVVEEASAYGEIEMALLNAEVQYEICQQTGYVGTDAFYEVIEQIQEKFYDREYTKDDVELVQKMLEEAYDKCLHSGTDAGADVSDLIVNRSFEDLSAQGGNNSDGAQNAPAGWTLKVNGEEAQTVPGGWCAINSGDNINVTDENDVLWNHQYTDGTHVWGIWNNVIPQVELSQKLTGLKPGTYILTADVMARNTDWTGQNLTTQRIFANDVICLYGSKEDYDPEVLENTTSHDVYEAWKHFEDGEFYDDKNGYEYLNYAGWDANSNDILLRTLSLYFGVGESGEATIGFRTDNLNALTGEALPNTAAGWFKLDNFTLYYDSEDIPTRIQNVAPVTTTSKVYDLQGRAVSKVQKGVYIKNNKKFVK